ncbi:DUF2909 domain-containing protein [Piscinibacter sakaiensis]|uniref:DUF2909 domain-containing protein n=1 Tax=Piscinibacter sakaiensis TaxID=1547922 RepID=UPI003AADFD1B
MTYLVGIAFVVILGALAYAGVSMVRDSSEHKTKKPDMMRALALRVGVSVLLFLFVLMSYKLGWIAPTGIPLR